MKKQHWVWIEPAVIRAIHEEQLQEHGGARGIRDAGLLASALARPVNAAAYGKPDAAALAASYGFGIAKNHPFVDGNKRVAFVAVELFLALNGVELIADDASTVEVMLSVAAGAMDEARFADWIRRNSRK